MLIAHPIIPLFAAVAVEVVVRVGASREFGWQTGMAHRTAPLPMHRGVTR